MSELWTEFREFHDEPRPMVAAEYGAASIVLGEAQRICRCCRGPIVKGTYHLEVPAKNDGSSYKFCGYCVRMLAEWIHIYNERNFV